MITIAPGDLFATPPSSWMEKLICRIIGAKTFHWGMFVTETDQDRWIITESLDKGVSLTKFDYPEAYIYRIKSSRLIMPYRLLSIVADYGAYKYDWDVSLKTALWWLCKHYLGKTIPRWHDKEVNCQEWVVLIARELGVKIISRDEYPMCTNLEHSRHLEYMGVWNG